MQTNPYDTILMKLGDATVGWGPETVRNRERPHGDVRWHAQNEWVYGEMANLLLAGAYAYTRHGDDVERRAEGLRFCASMIEALLDAAVDARWFHRAEGMGDANIDRFTLLPLLEAYLLVGDGLEASLRERFMSTLKAVLDVQYAEYGSGGDGDKPKRLYPNMDVYYCLIMLHGGRLCGDDRFQADFEKYLKSMERAQFDDGGWTYLKGVNECPVYHNINVLLMARIHELSGAPSAWQQISKSVPYYRGAVAPNGIVEAHTDCWWKHGWGYQSSYSPDTVASLTGDGGNRWVGDLVRERTTQALLTAFTGKGARNFDNVSVLQAYYAARLWKAVESVAPAVDTVRYDRNIEGPRGRFKTWSWAASARYGCDTLVGAQAYGSGPQTLCALMAVTVEIPYWPPDGPHPGNGRMHLCMPPQGNRGETRIEGDTAVFEAAYAMTCTREVFNQPPFPSAWQCVQRWRMDGGQLDGEMRVTSGNDQTARPPSLRIRFGTGFQLEETAPGSYRYGPFLLNVEAPDFGYREVAAAPVMLTHKTKAAVELLARSAADVEERTYHTGQTFSARVTVTMAEDCS